MIAIWDIASVHLRENHIDHIDFLSRLMHFNV